MREFWAIDFEDTVVRDDAISVTHNGGNEYEVDVAIVVPEDTLQISGFKEGECTEAVVGSFFVDLRFGVSDYSFSREEVQLSKSFSRSELDAYGALTVEERFRLLDMVRVARYLKAERLRNRYKFLEEIGEGASKIVDEYMILFNSKLAHFMNDNDIGAVYRVGIGRNRSYKIGPYYSNNTYGYVYASSPLRSSEARFNIGNVDSFMLGGDFIVSSDMPFVENDWLGDSVSHSFFEDDYDLEKFRIAQKFYLGTVEYKKVSEEMKSDLLTYFSSPKSYEDGCFEEMLKDLEDYSGVELWMLFLWRIPGNLQIIRDREVLVRWLSEEMLFDMLDSDFNVRTNWGEVSKVNETLTISKRGEEKSFELSDVDSLKSLLFELSKKKFDLL